MTIKTALKFLVILVAIDCIATFITVGYFGATELNPVCEFLGGINGFMIFKIIISLIYVHIVIQISKIQPATARVSLLTMNILYAGLLMWNFTQVLKMWV